MKSRVIRHAAACLAFVVIPGLVLANDIEPLAECEGIVEFDGRHYELVPHNNATWTAARDAALAKTFDGVQGHLATITSAAEDVFVESLRKCARTRATSPLTREAVWVGGFQDASCPLANPACGWQWVNGEGPIPVPPPGVETPGAYSNWLPDEPNNHQGTNEQHLTIGHTGLFGWNDEAALGNIGGYIIEYDTARIVDPNVCVVGVGEQLGCETTNGQTLVLPPTVILPENASIGVRTYEFTDDPARCGKHPLTLFGGADPRPELVIPPYLCGSPKFIVVELNRNNFEILQGTILVENEPIQALPGNLYECDGGSSPDPQQRDVVTWQATDKTDMLENTLGAATHAQFAGALGEFTFECGSSRGLTKNMSYLVIGLHINFGIDYVGNPGGVHNRFVALTRYKLRLLQDAVEQSRNVLGSHGQWTSMRTHVRNALAAHDRGEFQAARQRINVFLSHVETSTYQPTSANYQGEHLARARNILFTYDEKVLPFAP